MTWSTITSAFISLALAVMACAPVPCVPARDVVPEIVDATVALVADTQGGATVPICSGVWVESAYIATAGHCVAALAKYKAGLDEDAPSIDPMGVIVQYAVRAETRGYREAPSTRHNAQVVAYDEDHDLALLRASSDTPAHGVAPLTAPPALGAPLHLLGHARGYYWTYMRGYVCTAWESLPGSKTGPFLQVTGPVSNGMSGSGAWTEDGHLVGILSFYASGVPSTSFYVPSTTIAKILALTVHAS